jgi:hypothetical protein
MKSLFLTMAVAAILNAQPPSFVPAGFNPPAEFRSASFKLVPLGPALAKQDYDAYMSSIEHLQKTFSGNDRWPTAKLTMEDQAKDMAGEKSRFDSRKSFTYSVLTLDGSKELGCVYISPSRKQGYDAMVRIWVTKDQFDKGFEATLIPEVKTWLAGVWPFPRIAWPKREIAIEEWNALPAKGQ